MADRIFIGFGGNLAGPAGSPRQSIAAAARLLGLRGIHLVAQSALYESEPWGGIRQPRFVNGVWEARSRRSPQQVLGILLDVEKQLGRRRRVRWGARVIDLDLLAYGYVSGQWQAPVALQLPHPAIAQRAFVLRPFADLAAGFQPGGPGAPNIGQKAAGLPVFARAATRRIVATQG